MKWTDINEKPHGILRDGNPSILIASGETPKFLWAWNGSDHLSVWFGGKMADNGELTQRGVTVGFISPVDDMPEVREPLQWAEAWRDGRKRMDDDQFKSWLGYELEAYGNQPAE